MGNNWVREFREGTAQSPNSTTPEQESKVDRPSVHYHVSICHDLILQATFDPLLGFPNGRTPRVMTVSAEEMEAVQLQPGEKNFCADLHVKVCG